MGGPWALAVLSWLVTGALWLETSGPMRSLLLLLNSLSFLVWSWDKVQAQGGRARVPEAMLHLLGWAGLAGATSARVLVRHKTLKASFTLSAMLALAVHVLLTLRLS